MCDLVYSHAENHLQNPAADMFFHDVVAVWIIHHGIR